MIKNLVFKGGGVLGIAYAGAIDILNKNKLLDGVEKVAGTSAGAITACLLAMRTPSQGILNIVNSTDFKSFEDSKNILRLTTKYGMYKGDAFLNWIKGYIRKSGLPETATFGGFNAVGFRDLHIFATDLNTGGLKRFSYQDTPDVIVAEAVRASMSIPLFFSAWKFSNGKPDNHIYVDGGAVYNYPLTAFDVDGQDNKETVGFFLTNKSPVSPSALDYNQPIKYIRALVDALTNSQNVAFESDGEELSRSVVIDNLGISSTNFSLNDDQKNQLYLSGQKYTEAYLINKK